MGNSEIKACTSFVFILICFKETTYHFTTHRIKIKWHITGKSYLFTTAVLFLWLQMLLAHNPNNIAYAVILQGESVLDYV